MGISSANMPIKCMVQPIMPAAKLPHNNHRPQTFVPAALDALMRPMTLITAKPDITRTNRERNTNPGW